MNKPFKRLIWITAGPLLLGAFAAVWFMVGAVPPVPAELATFDPLVAEAIRPALWQTRLFRFSPDRWLALGQIYEANDVFDEARMCYEFVVDRRPDNARAWYRLACVQERLGNPASIDSMARVIQLDPTNVPAHWLLGYWLIERGRTDDAQRAFESALKIAAGNRAALAGIAMCHLNRGETQAALQILESPTLSGGKDKYLRRLLGTALMQAGRSDEALVQLRLACTAQPTWDDPWTQQMLQQRTGIPAILVTANDLLNAGDARLAAEIVGPAARRFPDHPGLQTALGMAYAYSDRADLALELLDRCRRNHPENADLCSALAHAWQQKRDFSKALEFINLAIKLNSRSASLQQNRGMILAAMSRHREAIESYQQAFALNPDNVTSLVLVGRSLSQLSDRSGAESAFRRAIAADPSYAGAQVALADLLIDSNSLDEAQQLLRRAEPLNPAEPGLAEARRRLLERREAEAASKGGSS